MTYNSAIYKLKPIPGTFVSLVALSGLGIGLLVITGCLSESREHWLESLLYAGSRLVDKWLGW